LELREEMEIVACPQIGHLNLMVNTMQYRTPHLHRELELLWLLEGPAAGDRPRSWTSSGRSGRNAGVQSAAELTNSARRTGACTFLCMQISPQLFPREQRSISSRPYLAIRRWPFQHHGRRGGRRVPPPDAGAGHRLFRAGAALRAAVHGSRASAAYTLVTGVPCRTVTGEQARAAREKADRLTRLLDFADANYTHKVRLTDFAAQEHLSLGYLSHFAKENLNRTFQEYVTELRFHQACKLLQSGGRSVLDVCFEAGFSDPRYLNEAFHTRLGVSPEEYRRSPTPLPSDPIYVHRSEHTMERFYSQAQSLSILRETEQHGPQ
jgi:AraC-like DNA-binding protein